MNTMDGPTKLVRQDAILGGLSIGQLNPGALAPKADALPLRHRVNKVRVTIVVKLFNCLDAICRNVNKQNRICGPHIFSKNSCFL